MASKSKYITILQFDEHAISMLRVHPSGKGVDVVAFEQERGEWSAQNESLDAALAAFAERRNLAADRVFTVLPRHEMTARILTLPSRDVKEIDGMVRLSAEEYVPYPLNELVIDQQVLGFTEEGQARVLAVFVHRDVVDTHLRLVEGAGLEPEQIYVSTACLAAAARAAAGETDKRCAYVHLSSGGLEVLVLKGNELEFSRAVGTVQDWSLDGASAAAAREELAVEVRASLSAHRRESEGGVDKILVSSDTADVSRVCQALAEDTAAPCAPGTYARNLIVRGGEHVRALPAVLLGAALLAQDRADIRVNLLPDRVLRRRRRAAFQRDLWGVGVLIAVVLAAFAAFFGHAVYVRTAYLADLEKRVEAVAPWAEGVAEKEKHLKVLQEQVERTGTVLELLAAVCEQAPPSGLNISRFLYRRGDGISIEGRVRRIADYQKLVDDLRKVGETSLRQFAKAHEGYTNRQRERGADVMEFSIRVPIEEGDEEAARD